MLECGATLTEAGGLIVEIETLDPQNDCGARFLKGIGPYVLPASGGLLPSRTLP